MLKRLSSFIYYRILGWELIGDFSSDKIKKCVIIVVPHTSWHDFYIGLLVRKIADIRISFVAKKELFIWPFGYYFRRVGGIALDRTSGQNKVEHIAVEFEKRKELRLAIAPEGTRKKVAELKTGFYYIAQKANVPVISVAFDFGKKTVSISKPFTLTDNIDNDLQNISLFFKGVKGKIPEYSFNAE